MTIELDKDALSAAWQAFYAMDGADPSGMEAAIRAYLTAIRQPQRDAVVEAEINRRIAWKAYRVAQKDPNATDEDLNRIYGEAEDTQKFLDAAVAALDATP